MVSWIRIKLSVAAGQLPRWALALLLSLLSTGCGTLGYYQQAVEGQWQIVSQRQSIDQLLASPQTPAKLGSQLALVLKLRDFAARDLKLPVNGHYLKYADLGRPYVVWNVHAAPEFSLEPKAWWYPIVGRLKYRGYFAEADARRYAAKLERQGLDTFVDGVEAYSTLGWFKDPVLNTFVHHREAELADILFHELAHQRLFAHGDTDFNEAFATAVAQEGVRRWLQARGDSDALKRFAVDLQRDQQFVRLVMNARDRLKELYDSSKMPDAAPDEPRSRGHQSAHDSPGRNQRRLTSAATTPTADLRQRKAQIITQLRADYERLKADWGGYSGYDAWMSRSLNNAQLNTVATYHHLVPAFQRLLAEEGGDLERFYRRAAALAKLDQKHRSQRLQRHPAAPASGFEGGEEQFVSPARHFSSGLP